MGDGGSTQIGDGVWAFVRAPGGWGEANTGLVVDAGTASLVVDTRNATAQVPVEREARAQIVRLGTSVEGTR